MATITYTTMPTLEKFKKDSSVTLAFRDKDIILTHIDAKLAAHHTAIASHQQAIADLLLIELFQSCNVWITSFNRGNPLLLKGRYLAVLALFEAVVSELARALGIPKTANGADVYLAPKVAQKMRDMLGFELDPHGVHVDVTKGRAAVMDQAQRFQHRVYFKHGLAYQRPWWSQGANRLKFVLADSSHAAVPDGLRNANLPGAASTSGYGTFVMSQDRNLFMARHSLGGDNSFAGIFHSSYTAGSRVIAAGSMKIQQGRILGVRTDSGHYQPTVHGFRFLFQALQMYGVNCGQIELLNHLGQKYLVSLQDGSVFSDMVPGMQALPNHRAMVANDLLAPNSMVQLKEVFELNRDRSAEKATAIAKHAVKAPAPQAIAH